MSLDIPPNPYRPRTLAEIKANIQDPERWIRPDQLADVVRNNPSLRGMIYGYVAEAEFKRLLELHYGISSSFKPDDHLKTKSDLTFVFNNRAYKVQVKSMQTNSIRDAGSGAFVASLQNDASDKRTVVLPNGETLQTTCYVVGEYDILAVTLHPFTREWAFAFKKNKDLARTSSPKYTPAQRRFLLHTTEKLSWPLSPDWTTDLLALLNDSDLGAPLDEARRRVTVMPDETVVEAVDVPGSDEQAVIIERPDGTDQEQGSAS